LKQLGELPDPQRARYASVMSREVLIFREADVRAALDMPSLIDAVERAFVAY